MRPFRKNVAIAVDGGGIKGVMVTRALAVLEQYLGQPSHELFRLCAGTSTGSIISAGIAAGLTGEQMHALYVKMGSTVFKPTWRSWAWPLSKYRYEIEPLELALREQIGDIPMRALWEADPPTDVVITMFDLVTRHTRFVKPWKDEYADWSVVKAVLASCCVPTYFPVVEGRYVDGGVGSYANPCYLAAYELAFVLGWDPAETTLISLGTGRNPSDTEAGDANTWHTLQWLDPLLGAFQQSADDQQVHLVDTFFPALDFRRFQIDLRESIEMDDIDAIPKLTMYGEELGQMILDDVLDPILSFTVKRPE